MNVPISENKTAEVRQPDSNESKTEKISAPLTTLSSHSDPYPHYFMTFASMQPRTAAVAGIIAAVYAIGGYNIQNDNEKTVASFGLLATSGPQARATKDVYHVALASLGAISAVSNSLKVYQLRTGKPKDLDVRSKAI
ncbi:4230_t:CDS:2 [Entrophospora sp. SA101]|nr:4230_t:CDS:2 [Entrophospora sp. SA101]